MSPEATGTGTGTGGFCPPAVLPVPGVPASHHRYQPTGTSPFTTPSTGTDCVPLQPVPAATQLHPTAGTGATPATRTGTSTHPERSDVHQEAAMLASDSIALDVQTLTDDIAYLNGFGDFSEADLRDACKQLRHAVDQLAELAREALILLSGHETDALARQDIPEPAEDDVELIAATPDELERLQEIAQTRDYASTSAVTDQIAERIGPEATELLIRQIIAAGAGTLLEILDAESADDDLDTPDTDAQTTAAVA